MFYNLIGTKCPPVPPDSLGRFKPLNFLHHLPEKRAALSCCSVVGFSWLSFGDTLSSYQLEELH